MASQHFCGINVKYSQWIFNVMHENKSSFPFFFSKSFWIIKTTMFENKFRLAIRKHIFESMLFESFRLRKSKCVSKIKFVSMIIHFLTNYLHISKRKIAAADVFVIVMFRSRDFRWQNIFILLPRPLVNFFFFWLMS